MEYFRRKHDVAEKYIELKKKVQTEWVSMTDYIAWDVFNEDIVFKQIGGHDIKKSVRRNWKQLTPYKTRITLNKFPYHWNDDIEHYVFWSVNTLSDEEITRQIEEIFPSKTFDWVYFINPPSKQSVPDIFHAHILVQTLSI